MKVESCRKSLYRFYFLPLIYLLLSSCSLIPGARDGEVILDPDRVTPQAGFGALIGHVENANALWPGKSVYVYAAEYYSSAQSEGVFLLEPETFPKALLDDSSNFVLTDMSPKQYVLLVGTNAEAALFLEEGGATVIVEVIADQVVELGDLKASP